MKVTYDTETDTITILLRDVPVHESDETRPGVVLDFDAEGALVAVEILDASRRIDSPGSVTLTTTPG